MQVTSRTLGGVSPYGAPGPGDHDSAPLRLMTEGRRPIRNATSRLLTAPDSGPLNDLPALLVEIGAQAAPPGEQPAGYLLPGQREAHMVAPCPVDVQVATAHSLGPEPELLHHPHARPHLRALVAP